MDTSSLRLIGLVEENEREQILLTRKYNILLSNTLYCPKLKEFKNICFKTKIRKLFNYLIPNAITRFYKAPRITGMRFDLFDDDHQTSE